MDLWRRINNIIQRKHLFSFPLVPDKKHLVTDFFNITRDEVGPVAGQKNTEGFGFFLFFHFNK